MGFNYSREKRKFDREWAILRLSYEQAGMSQKAIESIYCFDWEYFCSRRAYEGHTQAFPDTEVSDINPSVNSTLLRKFPTLTVEISERDFSDRYAWVDTIENPQLAAALKRLPHNDLELLTFLVIEKNNQADLAELWNCTQSAISKRFRHLKKLLMEIFK